MGRRVWETRNGDFRTWPREAKRPLVTDVYLPEQVADDFRIWLGGMAHLEFMRIAAGSGSTSSRTARPSRSAASRCARSGSREDYVYAFELSDGRRAAARRDGRAQRLVAAGRGAGCDLAVLPMGICEFDLFTGERLIHEEHPVLRFEATFEETLGIVAELDAGRSCSATSRRWTASPTTTCSRSSSGCRPRARRQLRLGRPARSTCERIATMARCPARWSRSTSPRSATTCGVLRGRLERRRALGRRQGRRLRARRGDVGRAALEAGATALGVATLGEALELRGRCRTRESSCSARPGRPRSRPRARRGSSCASRPALRARRRPRPSQARHGHGALGALRARRPGLGRRRPDEPLRLGRHRRRASPSCSSSASSPRRRRTRT